MIRNKRSLKFVSQVCLWAFAFQLFAPSTSWALTGGPSQPEVQSFQPFEMNDMVDPFTGDFSYNIPLMDVGGYPLNLSYSSGITMDQEASWVGLGWNLAPGMINRSKRGLPDEFNGDQVTTTINKKRNETFSFAGNFGLELFGFEPFDLSVSKGYILKYNNYTGIGVDRTWGADGSFPFPGAENWATIGLGLNYVASSNDGLDISPSVSFSANLLGDDLALNANYSLNTNSRMGFKSQTLGVSIAPTFKDVDKRYRKYLSQLFGVGYSHTTYSPTTYTPQYTLPYTSGNISGTFKAGVELMGGTPSFDMTGTYDYQDLTTNSIASPSFGYLNLEDALSTENASMDFNREKDGSFTKYTTNLPVTNLTHDLYSISGQGIGGMFRAYRSDLGYVQDPLVHNLSFSGSAELELSIANAVKTGANVKGNYTPSFSGPWTSFNDADAMGFQSTNANQIQQKAYFAMVGDMGADIRTAAGSKSNWWKSKVHGKEALRVDLTGSGYGVRASQQFAYNDYTTHSFGPAMRDHRVNRSTQISAFTISELADYVDAGGYYAGSTSMANLGSQVAKNHHVGQFVVAKTDGSRYVYGLPVYNKVSKDVTFNVSGRPVDCASGLVRYTDQDASLDNDRGQDNFYQSVTTPSYAHSYMLTEILSEDYSDFDQTPGPSPGDLGTYFKFEYSTVNNYKWRIPFNRHRANHDPAMQSKKYDDRAHYSYGEKELKYLSKIESRTHVAIFHTTDRDDAKGVKDEKGGFDQALSASMQKLDSINLYTKDDYDRNGVDAVPVKTVHFRYGYNLCKNIDNHSSTGQGKLTLEKVFFTYGGSHLSRANAYAFTYGDLNHDGLDNDGANPDYDLKAYDRWGSYSPNDQGCGQNLLPKRSDDPYTTQDKALADVYKAAWSLTDIQVPSGGVIQVDYESDDYAFVQDKRAMEMLEVLGMGLSPNGFNPAFPSYKLYDGKTPNNHLYVKVDAIDSDDNLDSLKLKYFKDIGKDPIYFKFKVRLTKRTSEYDYDWINGYAIVEEVGFVPGQNNEYAYIKIKNIKTGDKANVLPNANPISVKAWNYLRIYNSELAYSINPISTSEDPGNVNLKDVFTELFDSFSSYFEFIFGANGTLRQKGYAKFFVKDQAWVRVTNPTFKKLGGDVRVRKITISDSWDTMAGGNEAVYGKEYSYQLPNGRSSGVASYEPTIGSEENPFRMPTLARKANSHQFEKEDYLYVPGRYQEGPMGESFFPSPSIGYRHVEIKDIIPANASNHGNGKTVKKYYTAKDFPTIIKSTPLEEDLEKPSKISSFLKFSSKEYLTTGQGLTVIKNDMHGKPKAEWVYAQNAKHPQSGVEYHYRTSQGRLNNIVPLLHDDNTISENLEIGVEYDLVNDFRHMESQSNSVGVQVNFDGFFLGIIPIAIPTAIPSYKKFTRKYRSVATTKVVNTFGILKRTVVHNEEATSETENLLWDAKTGQVVLTKVNDRFDEEVYNFDYPAHFAYKDMGGAYQNEQYTHNTTLAFEQPFLIEGNAAFERFREGDKVLITPDNQAMNKVIGWVIKNTYTNALEVVETGLFLIDKNGEPIPGGSYSPQGGNTHEFLSYQSLDQEPVEIKVIESGYANKLTNVGSLTLKESPIQTNDALGVKYIEFGDGSNSAQKVLSASAQTYSNEWQARQYADVIETLPSHESWSLVLDQALRNSVENFLRDFLDCLATNSWLDAPVILDETHLINATNNPVSATDFSSFCQNLYGCSSPDGFAPNGIKTVNGDPSQSLVQIEVDWKQRVDPPNSLHTIGICDITISLDQCIGLSFSLVTNLCEKEFLPNGNLDVGITGIFVLDVEFDRDALQWHSAIPPGSPYTSRTGNEWQYGNVHFSGRFSRAGGHTPPCRFSNFYRGVGLSQYPQFDLISPDDGNNFRAGNGPSGGGHSKDIIYGQIKTWQYVNVAPNVNSTLTYYNPYVNGARGKWLPKANYIPKVDRRFRNGKYSGEYNLVPFWTYSSLDDDWAVNEPLGPWLYGGESTFIEPIGEQVEAADPNGIYSVAQPDNLKNIKVSGQNISYGEFLSLDFEADSWDFYDDVSDEREKYFVFRNGTQNAFVNSEKHTGKSSYSQSSASSVLAQVYYPYYAARNFNQGNSPVPFLYYMKEKEKLGTFLQVKTDEIPEVDYFRMSYWVKADDLDLNPGEVKIDLKSLDPGGQPMLPSNSMIKQNTVVAVYPAINGWQQVVQDFEVWPSDQAHSLQLVVEKTTSGTIYVDDLRIYPKDGVMTANVYDRTTGRLTAQLDDNNYASFYEYDQEGNLVRVKKETERGIETIQENRQNLLR